MVMSRVGNIFRLPGTAIPESPQWQDDPAALYRLLRAYYDGLELYDATQRIAMERNTWLPAMKAIRNPAQRVVEFYVAHLWPEELEIEAASEEVKQAIEQVWAWSNWESRQRLAARMFARDGDLFVKVVSRRAVDGREGRVYFQLIDAMHVLDFDKDERGNITYIKIEVPRIRRERDGDTTPMTHTEIWDHRTKTYRRWEREEQHRMDRLGAPTETLDMEAAFGIDFVPFAHAMFMDVGNLRGQNAFLHALDKIDETNLLATRLHQMLFRHNNVTHVLQANAMDASGRPIPPPRIDGLGGGQDDGTVTLGDDTFYRLPGNATLQQLVPNINYAAALAVVDAMIVELESDLPELKLDRLTEQNVSGVALRRMLAGAESRAREARGNALQLLARLDAMALTMGKAHNLPEFGGIGEFERGDFAHTFAAADFIPISEGEKWEAENRKHEAAKSAQETGVSVAETLRERGYSDEEIATMAEERDAERAQTIAGALANFDAGIDQ